MQKLKQFYQSLHLTLSDYMLFIGFLGSVVFYALAWLYMVTADPYEVFLKPWWLSIVSFSITVVCWSIYFYLQFKAKNMPNKYITAAYFGFLIISVVAILVQPMHYTQDVVMRVSNGMNETLYPGHVVGDVITVDVYISNIHKMFFTFGTICIVTVFFIMYFILPKRFPNLYFLVLMGICTFIFLFVLIFYSYITEADKYLPFFKALFSGDIDGVYDYAPKSFIAHRVPYGVCMMLGLVFVLLVHSILEKWWLYLLGAFYFFNMICSYCKTALIISALMIVAYLAFRLYKTYKEHEKRNKIIIITLLSLLGLGLLLTAASYISQGKILAPIYKIILSVTESKSLDTRSYIWDNTFQLLKGGWWIIGRGFGTYNEALFLMNIVNGDDVCPSHSSYNALLGAGGIIYLFGFIALLGYWGYLSIKCFKKQPLTTLPLTFGALAFLMYSITEGVHFLVCTFFFPIFILHHILYDNQEKAN